MTVRESCPGNGAVGTGKEMNTLLLTRQAWGSGNWQRDEHTTVNETGMRQWELAKR